MGIKLEAVRFNEPENNYWAEGEGILYDSAYDKEANTLNSRIVERYADYLNTIGAAEAKASFVGSNPNYRALFSDQDGDLRLEIDVDGIVSMLMDAATNRGVSLSATAMQTIRDNYVLAAIGQDTANGISAAQYKNTPPLRERFDYYYEMMNFNKALELADGLIARGADELLLKKAECLYRLDRRAEAETSCRKYIFMESEKTEPDHKTLGDAYDKLASGVFVEKGYTEKVALYVKAAGEYEMALEYKKAADEYGAIVGVAMMLDNVDSGAVLNFRKKELELLEKAGGLKSGDENIIESIAEAKLNMGKALYFLNRDEESCNTLVDALEALMKSKNVSDYYVNQIIDYMSPVVAGFKDLYDKTVKILSTRPEFNYMSCVLHMEMFYLAEKHEDTAAMKKYADLASSAASSAPENERKNYLGVYNCLAVFYVRSGDPDRAVKNVTRLIAASGNLDEEDAVAELYSVWRPVVFGLVEHGFFDEAVAFNEMMREIYDGLDEQVRDLWDNYGWPDFCLRSMEIAHFKEDYLLMERLYDEYEERESLGGSRPDFETESKRMVLYGLALWNQGRVKEAVPYLENEKIIGDWRGITFIDFRRDMEIALGMIYENRKEFSKAYSKYEKCYSWFMDVVSAIRADERVYSGDDPVLTEQLEFVKERMKVLKPKVER